MHCDTIYKAHAEQVRLAALYAQIERERIARAHALALLRSYAGRPSRGQRALWRHE